MIIKLNAREQRLFVEKILNPQKPCPRLMEAAHKWRKVSGYCAASTAFLPSKWEKLTRIANV